MEEPSGRISGGMSMISSTSRFMFTRQRSLTMTSITPSASGSEEYIRPATISTCSGRSDMALMSMVLCSISSRASRGAMLSDLVEYSRIFSSSGRL